MVRDETMQGLRRSLLGMAEDAYTERDNAQTPGAATYADGEGHAYGIAADQIRKIQKTIG
jgi:hypothetical protein